MPVLTLDYRHCGRMRPSYLKHREVGAIALQARQQLVDAGTDAIPLTVLSAVSGLKINRIAFELFVSTQEAVHDEVGNPVLGICEYDPGVPDTAMVSVSPVGENASEELVLSTLAHETGHAIFDAPGWIVDACKGPGLFDDPREPTRAAYRTTTRDGEHLARAVPANGMEPSPGPGVTIGSDEYFAELRANEFMGSLLVPRERLLAAVEELAIPYRITLHRGPSLDPASPGTGLTLSAGGDLGDVYMDLFQRALATRFGVSPRFIRVRLQRYGLLNAGPALA